MPKAIADFTPLSSLHNSSIGEPVDRLGQIKAEAAEVKAVEDALKAELIARGVTEAEGQSFRATVSTGERSTLDMDAVRAKLSPQFIAAHTTVNTVTCVRVVARKGLAKAA